MGEIGDYIEAFDLLGDWESRYAYLVELGERMAPMSAELKTAPNQVKGCMSTVHVAALPDPQRPGALIYQGDCDTAIIKGVLAVIVDLLSHKTPDEIAETDIDSLFAGLHLEEHLSPNRHFGIYAIVAKMKGQCDSLNP